MDTYRKLTPEEITQLQSQMCTARDWDEIEVKEGFSPDNIYYARFLGKVRMGVFNREFELPGGIRKKAGLRDVSLYNVVIGDNCCIEYVNNYIANYFIGDNTYIVNVDILLTDGVSTFGNGVEVAVLNETGGREVMIFDNLSAQTAYIMALYRHRPNLISKLRESISRYVESVSSDMGTIGSNVTIADAGYIKNVKIGDYCKIEGSAHLKNGSINSNENDPVHIGVGVIADNFIISSGASVEDGVTFSRCFIGQACKLGHGYSATDSLFFANCQGENGEACAIFAGPYTVTHHKSTLLIAGMFSFMNAGSGSNQSNHMYKLGPIHQGIMERGAKTSSDSYILWPAKVGAFSLVMGRHVGHQDTSNLPFSYLIEQQNITSVVPGANLKSVGTIRDAKKWPKRDARKDPNKLDLVNFNLLSPYTIQKMLNAREILKNLQAVSGKNTDSYTYQGGKINRSSLLKGMGYYGMAIDKFLGNSLISRIMKSEFNTLEELRTALVPQEEYGDDIWVDISGMIAPKKAVSRILNMVEAGEISEMCDLNEAFAHIHKMYYDYEWKWAYDVIQNYYGVDLKTITVEKLINLIHIWKESVVSLDNLIYEDARKEFSLSAMTSFGADGDERQRTLDFEQVRGSLFEHDPFVKSVVEHIKVKSELAETVKARIEDL